MKQNNILSLLLHLVVHFISEVVPKDYFTHILIDEGAQTREPETITPLIMANEDTHIVIAGDIQQVHALLIIITTIIIYKLL